ncbi:MAG: M48 family metalloprotease [Candidatus Omnitrophica bacterium]|nr:M48 family metalloprotease [Candidatus Omnitrophota bacterium]
MTLSLHLRMALLVVILFGIIYAIVSIFMSFLGIGNFIFYVVLAFLIMGLQYMVGPKIVELAMRVRYIKENEFPVLYKIVRDLAKKARIPMPRIGISEVNVPNAFAFGRSLSDGRVCVTRGILNLLNEKELKAVLGHEISHLKNRDVFFITLLSVIPLILYRIFFHLIFFGGYSRRRESSGSLILIGLLSFIFYFITNLLVLYASRIREYFADKGSIDLGNSPHDLATALYKLVYGVARTPKEEKGEVEGIKAFFLNDLSKARKEITELAQLDLDRSGTIDPYELKILQEKRLKLTFTERMMELLSTHPNMLKRIKHLSEYEKLAKI